MGMTYHEFDISFPSCCNGTRHSQSRSPSLMLPVAATLCRSLKRKRLGWNLQCDWKRGKVSLMVAVAVKQLKSTLHGYFLPSVQDQCSFLLDMI